MKIATVSAGYADGVPRLLSNRGSVIIKGKRAKIVGRVCMDQFCIDVTDIDDVKTGDRVTIFGEELSVNEVAEQAGTINYEIICGISKRVNIGQ
jgi:alanine racemase